MRPLASLSPVGASRAVAATIAVPALALALAACGSSDDSNTQAASTSAATQTASATAPATTTAAAGECGSVPNKPPEDPQGIVKSLGDRYVETYNGWSDAIAPSTWADWKPKGPGPYTVGIVLYQLTNPFQAEFAKALQSGLSKNPDIKDVILKTSDGTVPAQISQYNSLVESGADIVLVEPTAPQPFLAPIQAAAKKGVPTISLINTTPTPDAINVGPNNWQDSATVAAGIAKITGGKGNYVYVHGIPGTTTDDQALQASKDALALCPDIKLDDSVVGQFAPPTVKTEMLKYLSTHPGNIDAVLQTAVMAPSVIGAFEQAGRKVPPVSDVGAQVGSVAYWNDHLSDGYSSVGTASGAEGIAGAAIEVTNGLLAGRGLKINDVALPTIPITDDTVGKWAPEGATLDTPGTIDGGVDVFVKDGYVDGVFKEPASK